MARLSRRQRPLSLMDEDDFEAALTPEPMGRILTPVRSYYSRPLPSSTYYSNLSDDDDCDSPPVVRRIVVPAPRRTRPVSMYSYVNDADSDWSPPVVRRTAVLRPVSRAYVPSYQSRLSPTTAYDLDDDDYASLYPEPTTIRNDLTLRRVFDPSYSSRYVPSSSIRTPSPTGGPRSNALKMMDATSEDFDDALIQRSRNARFVKPQTIRPWKLRIPKFIPTAEFRQPMPKPVVHRGPKGRSLKVEEKVLINYHIARGKVPIDEKPSKAGRST